MENLMRRIEAAEKTATEAKNEATDAKNEAAKSTAAVEALRYCLLSLSFSLFTYSNSWRHKPSDHSKSNQFCS